ncbi:glycoside hydrolase family 61 protein [Rhizoctonia solani 123E]|uniref:lytic cellulose monooxygenase (C4-dehydrogenating) n=1 Tax=Rhizoctonia solani 123E TaxID=1423351 RepID=A0A074RY66_9AGAM|nr:glycoside hydrolase family 61 protein [Rhizoctonia solani 123E]
MLAKVAFTFIFVGSSVLAHGNLKEIVVEAPSATYTPWLPFQDNYTPTPPGRVSRKFPDNGPVEDVTSIDIQCNKGATPAALVATVAAGSKVDLHWTDWPKSHFGPSLTYLAKAPSDTNITQWSPGTDKVWFKIDEAGLDNGKWAATDVLLAQKNVWTVTIPPSLQAGQYLMRHELLALHAAANYPGAQFYPSCIQFEVTGSGTAFPSDSELVAFPGAYAGTDPGIKFNPYVGATTYVIPGPPVWKDAGSGSGSGGSDPVSPPPSVIAPNNTSPPEAPYGPVETESASSTTSAADSSYTAPIVEEPGYANGTNSSTTATSTAPAYEPVKTDVSDSNPTATSTADPSYTAPAACDPSVPAVNATGPVSRFGQCGGKGFSGSKGCEAPYTCKDWNPYYSQCV